MYADSGLFFPYFQNISLGIHQLDDYCNSQKCNGLMTNIFHTSSNISGYDYGGECDLFKAPEPIMEEPTLCIDPMTSSLSSMTSSEGLRVEDIVSMLNEQFLNDVLYECEKDLLEKQVMESPLSEILDVKIIVGTIDENEILDDKILLPDLPFQKSESSSSLSSMEWVHGTTSKLKPSFMDFPVMDFGSVYGMRRAFSEGDVKTLNNCNTFIVRSTVEQQSQNMANFLSEDRKEKLSRYRNKKTRRNFGRKIKYACRKALADSQPRIRGRFAKTEESDVFKM